MRAANRNENLILGSLSKSLASVKSICNDIDSLK